MNGQQCFQDWLKDVLPADFGWCGGCAAPTHFLTEWEATDLIAAVLARQSAGGSATEILRDLAWPLEVNGRSRCCVCRPSQSLIPRDGCYVYRLWAADDRLLYVGLTVRLRQRIAAHQRRWPMVARVTWESFLDEASMLCAEARAIRDEYPALNRALV